MSQPTTDEDFNDLALELFAFQFARNAVYQADCVAREATPATVSHWKDIPAVPTAAFKSLTIACFDTRQAAAVFHTSGTTTAQAGKHHFETLDLYQAAMRPSFEAHLLPDRARLPMFILAPSPVEAPHSSLSHMLGHLATTSADRARFYVDRGTLLLPQLWQDLEWAAAEDQPVFLLGTAFAFVHLLDHARDQRRRVKLPNGSRLMETGGYKGRSRELSKNALYEELTDRLGVPSRLIVNEYGMTELSTQFYDESLLVGRRSDLKRVPPWARVRVIDPHTGRQADHGQPGLLRIVDLANVGSCAAIQTEDLGIAHAHGFEILGRAAAAPARGCSLTLERLVVSA